jgi:hypothetical protein
LINKIGGIDIRILVWRHATIGAICIGVAITGRAVIVAMGMHGLVPNRIDDVTIGAFISYRRQIKSSGEDQKEEDLIELAKKLWKMRWSLLNKPVNSAMEEKQAMAELEKEDEGFVQSFRSIIRQLVNIFDHSHSEAQAKLRLKQLRKAIQAVEDKELDTILPFCDDHWDQAFRYLRKKGMGKYRRGSNSESGMRLLRRLEKNHDGIRSAKTRKHYIQIYQAMKYLSLDIADFIEKGPQMARSQGV